MIILTNFTYLFSFSLHNHCLGFFSVLKIRTVYFFQKCLILLFAIPCRYLHQHKIIQSRGIYDTEYKKVYLKDNKRFQLIYIFHQKIHYNIHKNKYQCPSTWLHLFLRYPSNWSIGYSIILIMKQFFYHSSMYAPG
jgi:hypothetical protein